MLMRPQHFGGLFDYSCQGANWIISDEVLGRQSPIDIHAKEMAEYNPRFKVDFRWKDFEALTGLENLEWTLRLKGKNMGGIRLTDLNGRGPFSYKVNHMHMHGPSEHRFEGEQVDLELHIVHELVKGPLDEPISNYKESLCVVAFLFKIDKVSHPFIKKMRPHDFGHIDSISFSDLLPVADHHEDNSCYSRLIEVGTQEPSFYHYKGSLTNPPCADVVNWVIHSEVLPIKEAHLNSLKNVWLKNLEGHGNFRDCQPLCGRKVARNVPYHHTQHHAKFVDTNVSVAATHKYSTRKRTSSTFQVASSQNQGSQDVRSSSDSSQDHLPNADSSSKPPISDEGDEDNDSTTPPDLTHLDEKNDNI